MNCWDGGMCWKPRISNIAVVDTTFSTVYDGYQYATPPLKCTAYAPSFPKDTYSAINPFVEMEAVLLEEDGELSYTVHWCTLLRSLKQ